MVDRANYEVHLFSLNTVKPEIITIATTLSLCDSDHCMAQVRHIFNLYFGPILSYIIRDYSLFTVWRRGFFYIHILNACTVQSTRAVHVQGFSNPCGFRVNGSCSLLHGGRDTGYVCFRAQRMLLQNAELSIVVLQNLCFIFGSLTIE